jgi:hypothetical protein
MRGELHVHRSFGGDAVPVAESPHRGLGPATAANVRRLLRHSLCG